MPELPEVETVRRVLEERLAGGTLASVAVPAVSFYRRPPERALSALAGGRLESVRRRGKYLLLSFGGRGELSLHLGMSGRLLLAADGATTSHCRLELSFDRGRLLFNDPRRFGRAACELPQLGPEPLGEEFTAESLRGALRGRRAPIKAALMDQSVVAGLGNIYATEALHRAGVRPAREAGRLSWEQTRALWRAIRSVLERGVALGGCTLDDEAFLDPLGRPGRFQGAVSVYGRRACRRGHALKRTARPIGGRTSLYCPECQR